MRASSISTIRVPLREVRMGRAVGLGAGWGVEGNGRGSAMRAGGHREWSTGCGRKLGVPDGRIAQQTVHGKLLEGGEAILAELVNDQDGSDRCQRAFLSNPFIRSSYVSLPHARNSPHSPDLRSPITMNNVCVPTRSSDIPGSPAWRIMLLLSIQPQRSRTLRSLPVFRTFRFL